ncbi:MAG: glycosyltransferase family 2 protein [Parafilimonas sp.]
MPDLSISVVLYKNPVEQLTQLINCIATTTLSYHVYLVDNSPTDELKNDLKKFIDAGNIEYIFNNKNVGYGAGHNIAIRRVINENKYHLVLNPDVTFGKGVLEALFAYMDLNDDVGQVIPKVLFPDGTLQYVCKLIPTPLNLFSRLLPKRFLKNYNEKFELRFSGYNTIMNIPYLSGSFMFLRCSALKQVGLFDERFFMYPEDIDLTRRMHRKYKTIFYPYVEVFHEHTKSSFKSIRMFTIHMQNIIRYFNKWGWLVDSERKKVNAEVLQHLKENNS